MFYIHNKFKFMAAIWERKEPQVLASWDFFRNNDFGHFLGPNDFGPYQLLGDKFHFYTCSFA